MSGDVTLYTVTNDLYYPGAAALLNSLRLTGNDYDLVVIDRGLAEKHRGALEAAGARVVAPSPTDAARPQFLKPYPHLLQQEGLVVLLDSDMIVTAPLAQTLERARGGRICVFADQQTPRDRWFEEWQEGFRLEAPLRHGDYLNSGFVALSVEWWPWFLRRWSDACALVPLERTRAAGAEYDQPFWHFDQDAFNALLLSEVPPGAVYEQTQHVTPVLRHVRVEDPVRLRCTYGGEPTTILHYTNHPKPWGRSAWVRVRRDAYLALLPRL